MYKDKVMSLRRKGHTIKEITKILGCSKTTASNYARLAKLTKKQINDLDRQKRERTKDNAHKMSEINRLRWEEKRNKIKSEAIVEWEEIKNKPGFLGFLGLYWGEGKKRNGTKKTSNIVVANTDPDIIRKCKLFFDRYDPKYYCYVTCYEDHDPNFIMNFWEKVTGCEIRLTIKKSTTNKRSKYGICYLGFNNRHTIK